MLRFFPAGGAGRARIGVTVALAASLVTAVLAGPSSGAPSTDDTDHSKKLHQAKNRLDHSIDRKKQDLDEISAQLVRAKNRLADAWSDLHDARLEYQRVRAQVKVAADHDREMQALLEQAIVRLEDAQADLVQGTQDVQTERSALAAYAVSSFQTGGTAVLNLGVAFNAETPQQALDGMQASATVLDKQVVALQQYEATKVLLELTEKRVQATKDDVQQKREDAASVLEVKRALQAQARVARANMLDRLGTLQDAKRQIADAKARERRHLQTMQRERNRVEERLRKIAERRARQHQRVAVATTHEGGGYLSYPVMHTYITSPYGMRMHPILHVWKLHDGTDFHAPCGTAVYAAAPGRVISEYYNVGYGNRLIVDHGFVHGVSLQTSYNHLTSWVAHPGQRVRRGQLIAYSGTTGYSTACHLHFMVYVNGYTVNPVTWL